MTSLLTPFMLPPTAMYCPAPRRARVCPTLTLSIGTEVLTAGAAPLLSENQEAVLAPVKPRLGAVVMSRFRSVVDAAPPATARAVDG